MDVGTPRSLAPVTRHWSLLMGRAPGRSFPPIPPECTSWPGWGFNPGWAGEALKFVLAKRSWREITLLNLTGRGGETAERSCGCRKREHALACTFAGAA